MLKEKTHWQTIWLLGRDNHLRAEEVASIIGYSPDWVRKIVRRYNKYGPKGLEDKRKDNGAKAILDKTQLKQLAEKLKKPPIDGGLWNGRKVSFAMQEIIGQKVSFVTGWNYIKSLGFSLQIPRPSHNKAANKEEQVAFKKN